ncbi:kinetochore-associated Ndc80 complex subunit spc25 [Irineochytrium annulatum]|nr:kinetochore-associated Ndc80 complex subunit spc25 [Irineochytrium annulatum]
MGLEASYIDLQRETANFMRVVDTWAQAKKRDARDRREKHSRWMDETHEKQSRLAAEIEAVRQKALEMQRVEEQECRDSAEMQKSVEQLSRTMVKNQENVEALTATVIEMQEDLDRRRKVMAERIKIREEESQWSRCETVFFEEKLALSIIPLKACVLRFQFSHINHECWEQTYWFVLDVTGRSYKLHDCHPKVPNIIELVTFLNETRDIYTFIKEMRKAFVDLAKKGI